MEGNSSFSASYYHPFGMLMPGRQSPLIAGDEHRYGFNGMEMDDEVKSQKGTSYDFGARMYDPRIGRWLSRDAYASEFPHESPYLMAGNSPILYIDVEGGFKIVITAAALAEKGSAIKIAKFEAIVKDLRNYLDQNPRVVDKLVEQTGLSRTEILNSANYGDGPTIYITTNNIGASSELSSFLNKDSGFDIDYTLIESLENSDSKNDVEVAKLNLTFAGIVFHEFTHWGDRKSNSSEITGQDDPGAKRNPDGTLFNGAQGVGSKAPTSHRGADIDQVILGKDISVSGGAITDKTGTRVGANFHIALKVYANLPIVMDGTADGIKQNGKGQALRNVLPKDQK
jgi:RHS repeat-associated protein